MISERNYPQVYEIELDGRKIALRTFCEDCTANSVLPFSSVSSQINFADGTVSSCNDECLITEFRTHIYFGTHYVASENCTKINLREFAAGRLVSEGIINPDFFKKDFAVYASDDRALISIVPNDEGVLTDFVADNKEEPAYKTVPMPPAEEIFALIRSINSQKDRDYLSKIHAKTQGTHCCYLWKDGKVLGEFEDISRHSAADKCIGYACLHGIELSDAIIFSTGRAPSDFIVKMLRAGVGTLVTKAVPTADGVRLAREIGLNLICKAWPDSFRIFSPESL